MQIEIKIDETLSEPRIIIMTNKITDEISELMQRLAEEKPRLLAGFKKETVSLLEQEKIIRIYAANSKVFAVTEDNEYQVRLRLYELEDRLDRKFFVRISNSEIINLRKIEEFDMSFTGTICVSLTNGAVTYVSRRYIAKIKQLLGLCGGQYEKKFVLPLSVWRSDRSCHQLCHHDYYFPVYRRRPLSRRRAGAYRPLRFGN